MRSILVLNSKGGCGKTTLATNLASYYAGRKKSVALVDLDPQQSSMDWLEARPDKRPSIHGLAAADGSPRVPRNSDVVVMDAPAAVHAQALTNLVRRAETLVMPVLPSPIDIRAAHRFFEELLHVGRVSRKQIRLAAVINRARENSPAPYLLEEYLHSVKLPGGGRLPVVAVLRASQNYIKAAERGLGVFELGPMAVAHDLELWRPLLRWLNSKRSVPTA